MTLSIWRYAHLALAIISSAFLLILSVTGVILAYDAIEEKKPSYRVRDFNEITLAQSLPALRDAYFEVLEIKIDHNDFVTIDAMDEDGNPSQAYINPLTGEKIAEVLPKSNFIQWTTALHRSLFLKEPGRAIVGIVSFLLMLITISGFVLILKRQKGIRHFFAKVNKDFFAQYFHVVTGRWLLIPVLIIAVTGTIIFMVRLDFFKSENIEIEHTNATNEEVIKALKDIEFFKNTKLSDVERVEFPFIPDDAAEPFIVHLKDRTVSINQITGDIISETQYPYAVVLEKINIDLHTGRTNIIWAFILGLASLNIVFFIYSGFVITFKRTRTKIKNKYKATEAEIVILVGSENGTTLFFANQIQKQLISNGKKTYLAEMNRYETYPLAKHLLLFTSTYGLGDPPTNATNFKELVSRIPQHHDIQYSIVGFGSKSYTDYCAYAYEVDDILAEQPWSKRFINLQTVNDRSTEEFVHWVQLWCEKSLYTLATAPAVYNSKVPGLKKFTVTSKTNVTEDNSTFQVLFKPQSGQKFQSGDLLAIYPAHDNRERLYSIGKSNGTIQLIVKLFPDGLGSSFLHNLNKGDTIQARIMANANFHLPSSTNTIAMIANGTGIAPFLGMIQENTANKEINLYVGFRYNNSLTKGYQAFADEQIKNKHLQNIHFAYSREGNKQYVMDLIEKDAKYFANLLRDGGTIMICGALKMQKDVEILLDEICIACNAKNLQYYINNKQLLTDCY